MNRSKAAVAGTAMMALAIVTIAAAPAQAQIKTTQLTANFYTLEGYGGVIGALIGPDGVFLVDGGNAAQTDRIMAAIRTISNAPVRFLVNTNLRVDHTGGNEDFAKLGVSIFARPELRDRLAHPTFSANGMAGSGTPAPVAAAALPAVTYDRPVTLHMNGEEIEVVPIPRAYTDGDSVVHFVHADVIMTGEVYQPVSYPNIDRAYGGTLKGLLDALNTVEAMAGPKTKIVPARDGIVDRTAVAAQRDMILVLRDRVAAMVSQGKSEKEVIEAELNADYPSSRLGPNRFMRQLYEELESGR